MKTAAATSPAGEVLPIWRDPAVWAKSADLSLVADGKPSIASEWRVDWNIPILFPAVDLVAIFEEDTPIDLITQVKPSVLVKGGDYTRDQVVGHEIVEAYGGEVLLVEVLPGFSTTSLVNRARGGKV